MPGPDERGRPYVPHGLSSAQVAERNRAGLTNMVRQASSRSVWEIIRGNVFTLFNAIVGASFVLQLVLGQWQDALFGFAAAGNAVIGVVQESRAKRALDRLAVLATPTARVLRDDSCSPSRSRRSCSMTSSSSAGATRYRPTPSSSRA